jgi:glycosyltransferase involved in cell wall biosynthesis
VPGVIVHEWFESFGGAEQVVRQMEAALPGSELFALWKNTSDPRWGTVQVSRLQPFSKIVPKPVLAPLSALVWDRILDDFDVEWVLASSHLFAHQINPVCRGKTIPKFVYCHTPARYLWVPGVDSRGNNGLVRILSPALQKFDRKKACLGTNFVAANSKYIKERILRAWGIESKVIYPPVDIDVSPNHVGQLSTYDLEVLGTLPEEYLLFVSRIVDYKRVDIAIDLAEAVRIPIVIVGVGPAKAKAEFQAQWQNVEAKFLGNVSDALLKQLYSRGKALIFPAIEDFGIVPVEAMAHGLPVIVNSEGGASETVRHGSSGFMTDFTDFNSTKVLLNQAFHLNREEVRRAASPYSAESFRHEIRNWVKNET